MRIRANSLVEGGEGTLKYRLQAIEEVRISGIITRIQYSSHGTKSMLTDFHIDLKNRYRGGTWLFGNL